MVSLPAPEFEPIARFPEVLATEIGGLARRLAEEREHELARAHLERASDREAELIQLRSENARLSKTLADWEGGRAHSKNVSCEHGMADLEACSPGGQSLGNEDSQSFRFPGKDIYAVWCQPPDNVGDNEVADIVSQTDKSRNATSVSVTFDTLDTDTEKEGGSKIWRSMTQDTEVMEQQTSRAGITAEALDLRQRFKHLDQGRKGFLNEIDLLDLLPSADPDDHKSDVKSRKRTLRELIKKVNYLLPDEFNEHRHSKEKNDSDRDDLSHTKTIPRGDQLNFKVFQAMLLNEDIDALLAAHLADALYHIRGACVEEQTNNRIAKIAHVTPHDLEKQSKRKIKVLAWLEPIVAAQILLNAVIIGASLDFNPDWIGWNWIEAYFSAFFLLEMVLKMRMTGICEHFTGPEWLWNWFDGIIVILAVLDMITTCVAALTDTRSGINLNGITIIRLARLMRIARVVRLLRLQFFKELTLMVNGVIGGLRTLFWAIILLVVLVYVLGVLMRQVMNISIVQCIMPQKYYEQMPTLQSAEIVMREALQHHNGLTNDTITTILEKRKPCNWAEAHLIRYQGELFGSVVRSMFTVFRCFTDGCNSADGTPLILPMWEHHGPLIVLGYVLAFLFVSFGVFNLIMAIFVENTLEYARHNDEKRHAMAYKQHVKTAQQLQRLVLKITSGQSNWGCSHPTLPSDSESTPGGLRWHMRNMKWFKGMPAQTHSNIDLEHGQSQHMRVTRDQFDDALKDPLVNQLLDELEISISNRDKLFDILDSDGNDFIAVTELVEGFMRLRGPADKGDIVSSSLMLRSLQRALKKFEVAVLYNQEHLKSRLDDLETMLLPKAHPTSLFVL